MMGLRHVLIVPLLIVALVLAGACSSERETTASLKVVTSMKLISGFVREVGGDRVEVRSLIPPAADPHSHQPSPRDARWVADADVVFANGLLLEDASIIKMLENNQKSGARYLKLGESVTRAGGHLADLRESVDLEMLWLGLAVEEFASSTVQEAEIRLVSVSGPGSFFLYQTDTFGNPQVFFNSADGVSDSDRTTLPFGSHTHLNWAFTAAGRYEITLEARLIGSSEAGPATTLVFAVEQETNSSSRVLEYGHADVTVSVQSGRPGSIYIRSDGDGSFDAGEAMLSVPSAARATVSDDQRFAFLGTSGVWVLPQAVTGRHVHGSTDPHIWLDPVNARAYVHLIQETLTAADPDGAEVYAANAAAYLSRLDTLEREIEQKLSSVPPEFRTLVTTHDAFGYLASRFGFEVVGFVVPGPGKQPSAADIARLRDSITGSKVPAVFVEPQLSATSRVLTSLASDTGVQLCRLYSESFDDEVKSYEDLMRFNAEELARCLQ